MGRKWFTGAKQKSLRPLINPSKLPLKKSKLNSKMYSKLTERLIGQKNNTTWFIIAPNNCSIYRSIDTTLWRHMIREGNLFICTWTQPLHVIFQVLPSKLQKPQFLTIAPWTVDMREYMARRIRWVGGHKMWGCRCGKRRWIDTLCDQRKNDNEIARHGSR